MSGAAAVRYGNRQDENQRRTALLLNCLLGALLFALTVLAVRRLLLEMPDCDYLAHVEKANGLTGKTLALRLLQGEDILWHSFVWLLLRCGVDSVAAPALVTGCVNAAQFAVCSSLLDRELRWVDRRAVPPAALALCMVTAIYVPWFSENIYIGQDSPNVWHSPTQLMVRPFALLVFWLTVRAYERMRQGNWTQAVFQSRRSAVLYTLLIVMSVSSKPSFFQAFVPGLGLVMLVDVIRSRGKAFFSCFRLALAFVPGAVLTVMRFYTAFYSGVGEGIEFSPLEYWSATSPCVPVSILLLFAFPLAVAIADRKTLFCRPESQIALAALAAATFMRALLIEGGSRRWHGNLTWAYGIASLLVWFVALHRFENILGSDELPEREKKMLAWVGGILLALHLASGVYYYIQILTGPYQC